MGDGGSEPERKFFQFIFPVLLNMNTLLAIRNLTVQVNGTAILDDVSLDIAVGKITAIVGGSGSGKTTLGLSILRLLPPALQITNGQINFIQQDILALPENDLRKLRGRDIGFIFQEPLSALNPLFTIGRQIDEVLGAHTDLKTKARYERVMDVLKSVEIPDPVRIYNSYPHQLSGGLRQRAMIAQAIVCHPKLIIADEPTSSLDVTVQAKIMALLRKLNKEMQITVILISHDLGMVSHLAEEIAVLRQGKVVETGLVKNIMEHPRHSYTQELLEAFV